MTFLQGDISYIHHLNSTIINYSTQHAKTDFFSIEYNITYLLLIVICYSYSKIYAYNLIFVYMLKHFWVLRQTTSIRSKIVLVKKYFMLLKKTIVVHEFAVDQFDHLKSKF